MSISIDKYIGCMLGVGIGDAMGYPVEGLSPKEIKEQFGGYIKKYEQRLNRLDLKPGSITDDTQMTLCIGESLAQHGNLNPDDIARRFVKWLNYGVGIGMTCLKAVGNIKDGTNWRHSGLDSAGNGAAMRVAPIGLFYYKDRKRLVEACRTTSIMTHTDPKAIAAAVAVARGVAICLKSSNPVDPRRFTFDLAKLTAPISREFSDKLWTILQYMDMDALEALDKIRTGAYVMESVIAAIYTFLRFHANFKKAILISVNAGYDADSVASITGSLTGALLGKSAIPKEWIDGLQPLYRDKLIAVAKRLYELSV